MKLYLGNEIRYLISKINKFSHPGASVLEIGCGPGYVSLETARAGYHVTGIDISQKAIEVARKTLESNPTEVALITKSMLLIFNKSL